MFKNKFKIFALDGPWGPSSGNNNPGSGGGFSGGNKESIDDLLNDLKNKYKIKMPFNGGKKGISFLVLLAFLGWLATGFYRVEPDEQGVELLFGKWNESTTAPGLHYFFPTPIGKVLTPKVEAIRKINVGFRSNGSSSRDVLEESMMLTSDQNISDLDYTVLYRIKDAGQFLFNLRDPEETVKEEKSSEPKVSKKEKAATKIVKKIDDKARYDDAAQTKTLIVMQILGNTKTFFDSQSFIQDTSVTEYLNKTIDDQYGMLFDMAQDNTIQEMINAQY